MAILKFSDVVDSRIQSKLEAHGAELADSLSEVYGEFSNDLSEEEFMEFLKRNMKTYVQEITDTVKDNL